MGKNRTIAEGKIKINRKKKEQPTPKHSSKPSKDNGTISNKQHGFIKNMSCQGNVIAFLIELQKSWMKDTQHDFNKGFNTSVSVNLPK